MRRLALLLSLTLLLSSCHVVRFFAWNFADIHDYKKFAKKEINKSLTPFHFNEGKMGGILNLPTSVTLKKKDHSFDEMLENTKTVAFLIIRNDSILYEKY